MREACHAAPHTRTGTLRAAVIALAVTLLAAGCATHPAAPRVIAPTPATACPSAVTATGRDPDTVAADALTAMWSADTATDSGWRDAQMRAAPYLTSGYLAALRAAPVPVNPGGQWATWRAHRAVLTATARRAGDAPPPDSATRADRQDLLTLAPVGRDGWHGTPQNLIVYITLTRPCASAPWQLAALEVAP